MHSLILTLVNINKKNLSDDILRLKSFNKVKMFVQKTEKSGFINIFIKMVDK